MFALVLYSLLAFITVLLFAWALMSPSQATMQERLRTYGYDLSRRTGGDLNQSFATRVLLPILRGITNLALHLTPVGMVESSRKRLRQARDPISLNTFLFLRLVVPLLLAGIFILPPLIEGAEVDLQTVILALVFLFAGYRLPDIWLSFRIDSRREAITRDLPDALDLIVVCVEAGHGLESAIAKVAQTSRGPLAEEFAQTLQEISLGRTRRDALADMSARCACPDLQTFIAAIIQAEQMGVSIAEALRVQADAMRVRRRQRAEELIAKAPVKMLFPLATCIFPALFVVLLGPAMMKIMEMFNSL